ncbi:hypothetical protein [Aeromicrobium sp. CTD01-1L150]|uniref:hypothetical protein n=1 Tax=Aeromicrobium sp. CTD01-1L150 TaxID=3341830 RepID=UPI0035C1254F
MDLQSWAAFATILAALLANFAMTSRRFTRLDHKIDGVHGRLDRNIDGVDAKLSRKIDGLDTRLSRKIDGVDAKLSRKIDGVDAKLSHQIGAVDTKLSHQINGVRDELRAEMRDGFAKAEARLITLEQRTYDLSLRLPPATQPHTG